MFTVGVGRHYRSIYRPTLGRYIGRVSVEYQSSIDRVSVEYRPICVSADTVLVSSTLGRYLIDSLPIVCRFLTDTRSNLTDTRTKCRLTLGRPSRYVSVVMSVVNCPTISYDILLLSVDIKEIFNQFRK